MSYKGDSLKAPFDWTKAPERPFDKKIGTLELTDGEMTPLWYAIDFTLIWFKSKENLSNEDFETIDLHKIISASKSTDVLESLEELSEYLIEDKGQVIDNILEIEL